MDILFGRNQLPVVISFIVCGIISGILFDLFKVKRQILGEHKVIVIIDDFVFMLTCALIVIFNAYAFNDGNLKWYEIPLMCVGFFTYNKLFSALFLKVCNYVIKLIKKLISVVCAPAKKLLSFLCVLCCRLTLYVNYLAAKRRILSAKL